MNTVTDSSSGSAYSVKKPRKATTASDGNLPPAAWPRSWTSRVVSVIASNARKTATDALANSRISAR